MRIGLGFSLFSRRYWGNHYYYLLLRLLRCFTSAGALICHLCAELVWVDHTGFSHSDIPGSKIATHLPEAYRSYAASFIAFSCQGIHHTPLRQMKTDYFNARLLMLTYLLNVFCYQVAFGTEKPRYARLIRHVQHASPSAAVNHCQPYHH